MPGSLARYSPRSFSVFLHRLDHEAPHLLGGILLHITGHMGVGVQREARAVVAQDAGDRLGIYTVLNRQRSEGMSQAIVVPPPLCDSLV